MTDFTNEIKFLDTHDVDLLTFSTNVAGTTFVKNSSKVLEFLKNKVSPSNIILKLIREPENEFDEYAVRVDVSVVGAISCSILFISKIISDINSKSPVLFKKYML